ncbi:MAG: ATP-binding cassette domain-containing protein, partial [Candidatus Hodarchaeota archaeon]
MNLLEVKNLKTFYFTPKGTVNAVNDVSFNLKKGDVLGLAGESGCGKTTILLSIARLLPDSGKIVGGGINFEGNDLLKMSDEELRQIRWNKISVIFQGAINALNPLLKVGDQIAETMAIHMDMEKSEALRKAEELLELVGVDPLRTNNYPHELSGGMKQ